MTKNWSQSFRYWMLTLLSIVAIYFVWYTRDLYKPLIIAVLLAYILNPFVNFLMKRTKFSRSLVVTVVFLVGIIAFSFLITVLVPPLVVDMEILVVDMKDILSQTQEFISQPIVILDQEFHLEPFFPDFSQLLSDSVLSLPENAFHILESISKNSLWVLIVIVATYYLLRDWILLRNWVFQIAPEEYKPDVRRLYLEIKKVWHGYFQGNLALMLIVGIVFSLAWIAIGVPGALVLGIITGVLTIIPEIGPAIAAGLAILVAFFEGSTYLQISNGWFALLVLGIYLVLIFIKNVWIRPLVFGRSVHMHEGVVFIAIMGSIAIQGILGALVIIPLLASASILTRYLFHKMQGMPPWPLKEELDE